MDWKAWNLLDYPIIIKTPMDLGTVRKNLKAQKYKTVEEVLLDIQQVWDNCHLYNAPGSVRPRIYVEAKVDLHGGEQFGGALPADGEDGAAVRGAAKLE